MPSRFELANAIRALTMDAVQRANSGHPGMPMGMADIAEVLWNDFLVHDPADPCWCDRDRFVLSNGHGSMLLYALLYLTGYDLSLDELKNFRQLHSKTPGHPEYGVTPGVETTTGPLGQGLANAVGMALAEALLAAEFNRDDLAIVDHWIYAFAGDGCLMEGVSHEAASLAGTLGLGKLVVFYDDNQISIDGRVEGWFRDDTPARFEAYGWQVVRDVDGHDPQHVRRAIEQARAQTERPTLIDCKTVIGFGAPHRAGTAKAHGGPLGEDEIAAARQRLQWPYPPFEIPAPIRDAWDARARGAARRAAWRQRFARYRQRFPRAAAEFERRIQARLPVDWPQIVDALLARAAAVDKPLATRKASELALDTLAPRVPELFGGSADLTESNNTRWDGAEAIAPRRPRGRYLSYGVREFGMAAAMNGVALHGGLIPFGGTFLVFSDYARNAIRLSALMGARVIYVLSHDSVGLGEDGPTHQPIEHLASLRLIPNLRVWRPADAVETAVAWRAALERHDGPSVLALSRQNLPALPGGEPRAALAARGAYLLWEPDAPPQALIIATGSEVSLALAAARRADEAGVPTRVVSMPCVEVFRAQDDAYRYALLPPQITRRVAVEAGVRAGWQEWVGEHGRIVGIDRFGESAPGGQVLAALGITADAVLAALNLNAPLDS